MKHILLGTTMLSRYGVGVLMLYLLFLLGVAVIGGEISESQRWLAYLLGGIAAGTFANLRVKRATEKHHGYQNNFSQTEMGAAPPGDPADGRMFRPEDAGRSNRPQI